MVRGTKTIGAAGASQNTVYFVQCAVQQAVIVSEVKMKIGATYIHNGSQEAYTYMMTTNVGCEDQVKWPETAVYQNASGKMFSRPLVDFKRNFTMR